jgi:hypothetical protein
MMGVLDVSARHGEMLRQDPSRRCFASPQGESGVGALGLTLRRRVSAVSKSLAGGPILLRAVA